MAQLTSWKLLKQIRAIATAANHGKALTWNNTSESLAATTLVSDHGNLAGLTDDDHAGYARLAGRASSQTLIGGTAANEDLTLKGTAHSTKTTSYVLIQPDGGSVGIGTTAPDNLVDINMGTAGKVQLTYDDANGTATDYATLGLGASGVLTVTTVDADGALGHLVLVPDGNVGIGTTAPDAALEVNMGTNKQVRLSYNDADGGATDYTKLEVGSNGNLTVTTVDADGSLGHIVLAPDGNVGIGTTAPDGVLEVNMGTNKQVRLSYNDADGGATDYAKLELGASGELTVTTVDADGALGHIILAPDGNVGIGTTAPDGVLEVNMGTNKQVRLSYNDADGSATDYAKMELGSNGELTVTTVDSDGAAGHINLAPDGNVGIKVAAPIAALDVGGGAIAFTEIATPDNPADTKCVLYAKDAGGGKTGLYVRFASGNELQISVEA